MSHDLLVQVAYCPHLGTFVSSIQRHKKQANKNGTAVTVDSKGEVSADIRFHPNVSIFPALSVFSQALSGNSTLVSLHYVGHVANLACVVI